MQVPDFIRPFLGRDLLWRVKTSSPRIYLTFDDGPVPETTPRLLDILDHYGWKATFFCVGDNVRKYPDLYDEILRRGHRTGNHSYNHIRGYGLDPVEYAGNVEKASGLIESNLFRPPHGRISPAQIKILKNDYRIVMWDVITYDYDQSKTPETILKTVKKYLRPGSVVVFHDSVKAKENMLTALPQAIDFWIEKGYSYGLL